MKFKCGKNEQEFLAHINKMKASDKMKWKPWFAWYPVEMKKGDCRWLEIIERRYAHYSSICGFYGREYREKQ